MKFSLRWWLLGTSGVVLLVPFALFLALRLYDTYLVRQTERQLIAQAVVIAEIYREMLARTRGKPLDEAFRPPDKEDAAFIPIEPVLDLGTGVLPPQPIITTAAQDYDEAQRRAGAELMPLLRRAQVFNLTAVRVLDERGCVVATSRGEEGLCLSELPEVDQALRGRYAAVARERISDEPLPPLSDVRSRGSIRIFSALPVFEAGRVVAVVRVSRTSLDALTSLWHNRRGLLLVTAVSACFALVASLAFAALMARPLARLTDAAKAIAAGAIDTPMPAPRLAPSEVTTLGRAIATMTDTLRARAAYVEEFALSVSHELKTPITGIRGASELLRESWTAMDDEQRQRFLSNIDADARRMELLVTRLLELARVEHATASEEQVQVEPFFAALAQRYGARVRLRLSDPPASVRVSPEHLMSCVQNLIENALRHGGEHDVDVDVRGHGARLRVDVRDYGTGISPNNQGKIFERFFTTERDHGGTGLGLTIVKAVADRYGGEVSFSTSAQGSTFSLVL